MAALGRRVREKACGVATCPVFVVFLAFTLLCTLQEKTVRSPVSVDGESVFKL